MAKIISIHPQKEPSLLDAETRFNLTGIINEGGKLQSSALNNLTAASISINTGILFGWDVFSNELEFE